VWYLWVKNDTHGKKTIALENLPSKHDQAANRATDKRDYAFFINKQGRLVVGTTHCAFLAAKGAT